MTRRVLFALLLIAVVWLAAPFRADGATFVFQTDMYGKNMVPPVSTGIWGFVRFFFNDARTEADYTVDVKGISSNQVQGADMFKGQPGANGTLVRHLAEGGFLTTGGHLSLSPAELAEFINGDYYVVLYTADHPEGAIRGQVYVPSGFIPGTTPNGTDPTFAGIPDPVKPQPQAQVAPPPPAQEPPANASPPQANPLPSTPKNGGIQPPNTGDGGLLAVGVQTERALMVGVATVIIGVGLMVAGGPIRRD